MNRRNDLIIDWAVRKIEKDYRDDVSLLVMYGSYENGTWNPLSDVDFYLIPKTERACDLCKTFVVEGIGYDLFAMSWDRVEGLAELSEQLTPCLGNARILYCNSEEDRKRFARLQSKLKGHLADRTFMLKKAYEKLSETMNFFGTMAFEEDLCVIRKSAMHIAMFLSDAVAYANQTYFTRGLKKQIEDLKNMKVTPEGFVDLYESIVQARSEQELKNYCYEMVRTTKAFLDAIPDSLAETVVPDYRGLARLYQEIISTWNKIKVACNAGDAALACISGACLQDELDLVAEENGFRPFDLLSAYDAKNLEQFRKRAEAVRRSFVEMIEEGGAVIEAYTSVEEFLERNQ